MKRRGLFLLGSFVFFCLLNTSNAAAAEPDYLDTEIINTQSSGNEPFFCELTCYIEQGNPTVTGSTKTEGIIASKREWLGQIAALYKVGENGGLGDFIGFYEVTDVGYGKPTGFGASEFEGRKSAGTIETGLSIDMRQPNYAKCVEMMEENYVGEKSSTCSGVYVLIIGGEG